MDNNGNEHMLETPYEHSAQHRPPEPHRGMLVLIFGILGLFVSGIFGLLAWIFGNTDLKKMDSGRMDPSGRENTKVGRIMGIVGVGLNLLGLLIMLVWLVFLLGITMGGMSGIF